MPNYNMLSNLKKLLPFLVSQHFDGTFLLDDASSDGSADYVAKHIPEVTVVSGKDNVGACANRNRLLPFLSKNDLVLFVDADLEFASKDLVAQTQKWFDNPSTGMVGGQILSKQGTPMWWNYGLESSPKSDARNAVYESLAKVLPPDSAAFKRIRELAISNRDTYNFEIQYSPAQKRVVDWVAEGLFAIRSQAFLAIGGYDEAFRFHGDQDLAMRMRRQGWKVEFNPSITARHLEIDVRGLGRAVEFREGLYRYYKKHWHMSRSMFDKLF